MKAAILTTPQEAEAAFYEAFEKADLEAMMEVWSDDEDIVCVHPNGPRLTGIEQVRESWRQTFTSGQRLSFRIAGARHLHGMMLAVHSVYEYITVTGQGRAHTPMIATNVYQHTPRGWRMVMHHASPAPASAAEADDPPSTNTLH